MQETPKTANDSAPRTKRKSALPPNFEKRLDALTDSVKSHRESLQKAREQKEAGAASKTPESPQEHTDDPHDSWDAEAFKQYEEKTAGGGKGEGKTEQANPPPQHEETPPEAWEQYGRERTEEIEQAKKTLESAGMTVSMPEAQAPAPEKAAMTPEQQRERLEKLLAVAEAEQAKVAERAAETKSKSVMETLKGVGEAYNRMPTWKKLAIGAPLLALGIPGASVPQKVLSGLGMFVTLDAALQKRVQSKFMRGALAGAGATAYAIFASQIFSAIDSKLGVSETVRGWFGGAPGASGAPSFDEAGFIKPETGAQSVDEAGFIPPSEVGAQSFDEAGFIPESKPLTGYIPYEPVGSVPQEIPGATATPETPLVGYIPNEPAGAPVEAPAATPEVPAASASDMPPAATGNEYAPAETSPAPEAPAVPPAPELFSNAITVARGDTLWSIIERQMGEDKAFAGLDRAQKDFMIDSYVKSLDMPNKDTLAVGQRLDLSSLNNQELHDNSLAQAHNLTDAQKQNILSNRIRMGR